MALFESYIASIQAGTPGLVPFGGTIVPASNEGSIVLAMQIKGGSFVVPDLDTLADIPYGLLTKDMTVTVSEHTSGGGKINPRTKYYLFNLPPTDTRVNEVVDYVINNYWRIDTSDQKFDAEIEVQYAPNFEGQRPLFLPTQISYDAYQAGYPNDALFVIGNPADIIWVDTYDAAKNHLWMRQRLTSQPWGIPISITGGNYEAGQYIDVIFLWLNKGNPYPQRPIQPNDSSLLPTDWQATPGDDYATRILTQDLYRSQAVRNSYGILKSSWDLPILVSTDPQLTRYGNTPGNTDFLNDTYWRGYYTPGLDTFQATRPNGTSTDWTVSKIDQESGEFPDFVFKEFPIGTQTADLIAATPTAPEPLTGVFPNDWSDAPFEVAEGNILYMSKAVKYSDGSLKTPWSTPKRFDGLDTIQAVIEESPGDTFYESRNAAGNLQYAFPTIDMVAKLYKGPDELTSGITAYHWYRGATLIVFSGITNLATNLGGLNSYHVASPDRKTLTIAPGAVDVSQTYKVGIAHPSRVDDYEDTIQIRDSTDDGEAFVADIIAAQGLTFKNQSGLFQFTANFYKGGVLDNTGVTFTWSIKDGAGSALTNALRNSGGSSIGDTNVAAGSVYVSGADVPQYATLILTAVFGGVTRTDRVTLTNVFDAKAVETLYWGSGSTDPGSPTDFTPRTLTTSEVLALAIGYSTDATGRWYMIQRIDGVWGGEIQMRAESARPNGGINLFIYKNVQLSLGAPGTPTVPPTGSIIPAGWTSTPSAFVGLEDATFLTSCFFLLRTDVTADPTVLDRSNYTPVGTFGAPVRITGIDGANTNPGIDGEDGWSPVLAAVVVNSTTVVMQVIDWVGGTGTKPAAGGTNSYIGPSGLTTIGAAINIKGPMGDAAQVRPQFVSIQGGTAYKTAAPETTVTTAQGEVLHQYLNLINAWTAARWFLVIGEIGFREDTTVGDIFVVRLRRKLGAYSGVTDLPTNFRTYELLDTNKQRVDIDYTVPRDPHKILVMTVIQVPAASTHCLYLTRQITDDSGGKANIGNLMAIGL